MLSSTIDMTKNSFLSIHNSPYFFFSMIDQNKTIYTALKSSRLNLPEGRVISSLAYEV